MCILLFTYRRYSINLCRFTCTLITRREQTISFYLREIVLLSNSLESYREAIP
nr:MAG TPA: hypothetical protein [Caudoviricetes sp.]